MPYPPHTENAPSVPQDALRPRRKTRQGEKVLFPHSTGALHSLGTHGGKVCSLQALGFQKHLEGHCQKKEAEFIGCGLVQQEF